MLCKLQKFWVQDKLIKISFWINQIDEKAREITRNSVTFSINKIYNLFSPRLLTVEIKLFQHKHFFNPSFFTLLSKNKVKFRRKKTLSQDLFLTFTPQLSTIVKIEGFYQCFLVVVDKKMLKKLKLFVVLESYQYLLHLIDGPFMVSQHNISKIMKSSLLSYI